MYRGPWEFKKDIHPRTRLLAKISQREYLTHTSGEFIRQTVPGKDRERRTFQGGKAACVKARESATGPSGRGVFTG